MVQVRLAGVYHLRQHPANGCQREPFPPGAMQHTASHCPLWSRPTGSKRVPAASVVSTG